MTSLSMPMVARLVEDELVPSMIRLERQNDREEYCDESFRLVCSDVRMEEDSAMEGGRAVLI